ncbi:MAG TPA: IPT/TIG domain-containing protein [Bryobacteraceae bacterium]|nr:IPT/TIG domain-containing protein [Bryobacteraceae bacterium]
MMRRYTTLLPILFCLPAAPVLAQPAIGSSPCNSSTLNGTYQLVLNGRQQTATGITTKLFQAVGTATFDGLSKVTFTMTANTVTTSQSFGSPLVYSGSYSLQSNCLGAISITSGDAATFTLESYYQGKSFAVTGSDANYAYNGTANAQPASCPTTLSGVHEFSANGSSLSGPSLTAVLDVAGVLQFDGQGNVTAQWTQVSNLTTTTINATGTYSLNSTCLASATVTDTSNNKYAFSLSIYSTAPDFALTVTSPQLLFSGYGSAAQAATGTGCAALQLSGPYEFSLSGRLAPGGIATKILSAVGAATFDGQSKVTFTLTSSTVNGSQAFGTQVVYSGTYSLASNCQGSINITSGDTATFAVVAYSIDATTQQARAFTLVGTDATYAYSGGGNVQPSACAASTLSGTWPFSAVGNALSGSSITGVVDITGVMQFDGQGNVTGNWTQASNTATASVSATGTYSVTAACLGTLTLTDAAGTKYAGSVSVFGAASQTFQWVTTDPQLIFSGAGRVASVNPGQVVENAGSFLPDKTPAGSVFAIFGVNLATGEGQPTKVPLPTTLLTTTVTVNGEPAPLFYVSPTQINAQMPEDIKPGVATVIVKNGSSTSNAAAVIIPATGTPGIVVYGNNRAVVVNQDGSVNSPTSPAKVGDVLVAYFTGGGPVNAAGPLVTGAGAPDGLSPVSGANTVKVSGVDATVNYMGLTSGSIGLYQANFVVPKVAAGDHPLLITISGQNSNNPLIAVSN